MPKGGLVVERINKKNHEKLGIRDIRYKIENVII